MRGGFVGAAEVDSSSSQRRVRRGRNPHPAFTVSCPGMVMLITAPDAQVHFDVLLRAGWPFPITAGDPGAQGPTMTGIHGTGVSTPRAAAVAAATAGFVGVMHLPNGG